MIASFIVKNSAIKALNKVIKKWFSSCAKDWNFESWKIVRRFSKTDVDFTKLVNFDVCFFENFVVNSFDIMNDFLKVWNSLRNFSILCFSTVMTFFNSCNIFFRVWARVFLSFTSDSSNTWITEFSFFSKDSSRLRRFVCVVNSFSNWRRFSRWVFSIDVAKRRSFFVILTCFWLFEFLSILTRDSNSDWFT
jgi:hypothetical protein